MVGRRRVMTLIRKRYGPSFTISMPPFGRQIVVTSDPDLIKQVFAAGPDVLGNPEPNLGRVLGERSVFGLEGEAHRARRKLLVPSFHGQRLKAYQGLIEAETLREAETWPQGREFETLTPFRRITLNVILRAVFGAEGAEFEELRQLLPQMVERGSKLALLPIPPTGIGPWNPWRSYLENRRRYDRLADHLITAALADPALAERNDVLAILLQSRYEDGGRMSRHEVADELLALLTAGHETTAATLAWAVERLRRHPAVLYRLVDEIDRGGCELLRATLLEVQRTRPVIVTTARRVEAPQLHLGEWVIPQGYSVLVGIHLVQQDDAVFPDAAKFDPDRFISTAPDAYAWIPFGGGTRRCPGAAFAELEMTVVLRTLLREFDLGTSYEPGEPWRSHGVTYVPGRGGRAVVHRRQAARLVTAWDATGIPV